MAAKSSGAPGFIPVTVGAATTLVAPESEPVRFNLGLTSGLNYVNLTFTRLLLLRHEDSRLGCLSRMIWQQGQRARVLARATVSSFRIVAIEFWTCRSGRTGGLDGSDIGGNASFLAVPAA